MLLNPRAWSSSLKFLQFLACCSNWVLPLTMLPSNLSLRKTWIRMYLNTPSAEISTTGIPASLFSASMTITNFLQSQSIQISNSPMNRTFSIQNMESYFKNYVPCVEHRREPITNFCTERICLKFMCPECVEIHSRAHANHPIQSIKTCIRKSSAQIERVIKELEAEEGRNGFLKFRSPQEYENEMIRELEEVKKGLIEEINHYFTEKQRQIKRETSKTNEIKVKMQSLQTELSKAIEQLNLINKNLFINQQCVNAIKKANKIDYGSLCDHFRTKIQNLRGEMDVNLKVQLNPNKRQQFRRVLNSLVGIRSKNHSKQAPKPKVSSSNGLQKTFSPFKKVTEEDIMANKSDRVEFILNPPPLSADRLLSQAAFKIQYQNFFQVEPFLHFFQSQKPTLHLIKLKDIKQNQPLKWSILPLNITFTIPSFYRSIATQNGGIYLIGGTHIDGQKYEKSADIYQFDSVGISLRKVNQLNVARSSAAIACFRKMIYIVGGIAQGDTTPKKCQVFNTRTNECKLIAPCKYPTHNSTLCTLGKENLIKLGGIDFEGRNSDFIEIYNIASDFWGQVDPTIEQVQGEFGLLSCSGWAPLTQNQIFIFGGYNEQAGNQNSKMSYILEYKKQQKQFYIKHINMKNLPIAEGFWNPQSIVHNGVIYVLQNVDGEAENDCAEDKRNLLIFNGKLWTTCLSG